MSLRQEGTVTELNETESETVRVSKSLNEGETKHMQERMVKVEKCLKDHGIQCESNNVPRIAVLGSGGGERAMIGLLGCLDQLYEANLLDSILYLCGVSGSTWCMTSMYEDAAWSTKVPRIKEDLVKRLTGTTTSYLESIKWLSQAIEDENFSLTDIWAAHAVYGFVKKIDTTCLSDLKDWDATNPYPIYAANDQVIKHKGDKTASSFELSPHEVGYSHIGAFVDTSSSRSQFEAGVLKEKNAERDMLYLQGMCGSALADRTEIHKHIWKWIKDIFTFGKEEKAKAAAETKKMEEMANSQGAHPIMMVTVAGGSAAVVHSEDSLDERTTKMVESILQLVDCENEEDAAKLFQKIESELDMVMFGEGAPSVRAKTLSLRNKLEPTIEQKDNFIADIAHSAYGAVKGRLHTLSNVTKIAVKAMWLLTSWTWGTTYNFLYKYTSADAELPEGMLSDEKTYLEDAGLVLNSPYAAALRPDRKVNLILSFDFSAGDPFLTVTQAAEYCKQTGIPFPPVDIAKEDKTQPDDFYVFKSENTPTVIHMPLFNKGNCEGDCARWHKQYKTFQRAYNKETMDDLIRVSGLNVANNKNKIIQEIKDVCK